MTDTAVELNEVSKYYKKVNALHPLSLKINAGEVLGLFGHNGAGKSTLMKLILGVLKPTSGNVNALGYCPRANNSHEYRAQFGYLPENVSFYEHLSGREVLNYLAKLKGHTKKQADQLLDEVNLSSAADRAVKTYSKGMRQRLGLAQAFLGKPKLLILDEPTVGLDPVATRDFYQTVDRLKSGGCAVILCSHVLPGVEHHIDRAMILSQGRQLALGKLDELRAHADLPVEFSVSGLSRPQIESTLDYFNADSLWLEESGFDHRFSISASDKLRVMKKMLVIDQVKDLQVKPPTLEDLYRHYLSDPNSILAQNAAGATHG